MAARSRDVLRSLYRALPGLAPTFLVVALLACVLVPLPTALVDLLLSLSLAGAVLLLVASLGIRRTSEFLSFPTLLLLVTLFRLALNVSTTRLILSQADAGQVIDAFASFVVREDLIVGAVMFLIITVVQYVVIARGAERVAEVAARFALDGLPGHQAAIEADLRAGMISASEASRRRTRLAERSSFYGAMDGAIRFVKGDAVAGLAITAINILGGLAVGTLRDGMTWDASLGLYGRLTIGDGLLAQIPALLVSLAAGVLVSRVDRQDDSRGLAWLEPAMLVVPATLLVVLAAIPAMPTLAFITTAVGLITAAILLASRRLTEQSQRPVEETRRSIAVCMDVNAVGDVRQLNRSLSQVRDRCREALGVEVPPIEVMPDADSPDALRIRLGDRMLARVDLPAAELEEAIVVATFRAIMDQADTLIDLQDLDRMLERVRATHPALVREALAVLRPTEILTIIRAFLRERIPVPSLEALLGVVAESRLFREPSERARFGEIARERLAPYFVQDLIDGVARLGSLRWVRPTPDAEDALVSRSIAADDGLMLNLGASERAGWLARFRAGSDDDGPAVVLTTPRARRVVAALLTGAPPHTPVLSTAELDAAHVEAPDEVSWVADVAAGDP